MHNDLDAIIEAAKELARMETNFHRTHSEIYQNKITEAEEKLRELRENFLNIISSQ
jgi:hypothetical protein